ncbi:MAG: ABC transporter permease [Phycisphaeraceae bacterium]|nr:ABC transporter permease [Phycisphaeraceae bacterium]
MTDFTIILRSLTSRLFSTLTTVITVAVAVGLMLVLLSMRDSGRRAFERGSGSMHLIVSRDASPMVSVLNGVFYANPPPRSIDWAKYNQIAGGFPLDFAVPIQQGDSYRGYPVLATTREFFTLFRPDEAEPWSFAHGRAFDKPFEVVVGSQVARATGLRVGDTILLSHGIAQSRDLGSGSDAMKPHVHSDYKYTVVGVLDPTGSAHDRALFTDLNSTWIIHAHDRRLREDPRAGPTTIDDLADSDRQITGIYLRAQTRPGSNVSAVLPQVFDALRRDTSIVVASPRQQIDSLFKIIGNIDQILLAMAAVVMVSSAISIMLALYNSMDQRRRQIAVLRVLGCTRFRIFGLVVTESVLIGLLGSAAGLALCFVGVRLVAGVMKERLGLVIDPILDPRTAIAVLAGAVLLAALAGIVPAITAYRTSVARNLRPIG